MTTPHSPGRPPTPAALSWVTGILGPDARIDGVRLLPGATSSTLHGISATANGRPLQLVLRQFTNPEWLAEEPDLARHEAASLGKARQAGVLAPELVALDETGAHCGVPAILMTRLAGHVELQPEDMGEWLYRMAEAIRPLHTVAVGDFAWHYRPYNDVDRLEPPPWSSVPELWSEAIEIVQGAWPGTPQCFIHRDYHPNNVLWQGETVTGIVDWPNACRGPANIDVAWCRGNLIHLYDVEVADRFLRAYQALSGSDFQYHPFWDLMVAIETLPGPLQVYPGWVAHGVGHVTGNLMRQRADEFLVSVMARF